jgi:hypothetical protein
MVFAKVAKEGRGADGEGNKGCNGEASQESHDVVGK